MTTSHYYSEHGNAIMFHVRRFTVYMKLDIQGQSKPSIYRNFFKKISEKVAVYWFTHEHIPNRIVAFIEIVYSHLVFTLSLQQGIGNSISSPVLEKMSSWLKSSSSKCQVDADKRLRNRHNEVLGKFLKFPLDTVRARPVN